MIRNCRFDLTLHAVYCQSAHLDFVIPTQEQRIDVLKACDRNGRFNIGGLSGRVTRIFFGGFGTIPVSERGDFPKNLGSYREFESVSYDFGEWIEEGRPLKLRLDRVKKYTPVRK